MLTDEPRVPHNHIVKNEQVSVVSQFEEFAISIEVLALDKELFYIFKTLICLRFKSGEYTRVLSVLHNIVVIVVNRLQ